MAVTSNLLIPLLSGNTLVNKNAINAALNQIDQAALSKDHLKSGGHWAAWSAGKAFVVGDVIRTDDCYSWGYLQCTTAGTSGTSVPACPYGEGDTVTDGKVVWTLKKIDVSIKHGDLIGRSLPDQHPMDAITGLKDFLNTLITSTDAKAYTDKKIADLIDGAPDALNTLKELADKLSSDDDTLATLVAQLSNKVDKITGKGLSTNDYDNASKAKIDYLTVTKAANIDTMAANSHSHANKALLDTYDQTNADIKDAVTKKHAHSNLDILNKFSENSGSVKYNGAFLMTKKDAIKFALIF